MGQEDNDKVKGQNLVRMNLIVKRIENELDQLKNLIILQIDGLTTSLSTNCDGDSDGNCDTSISIIDTLKIEDDPPIDTTAEYIDKVSNPNSNYQYEFNNEDQGVDCQNKPSNEDELILGGVDFNCEILSKEVETHVDPPLSSSYFTSFQNQEKVISQAFVDLKPDVVESIQISNGNLEGLLLEVAAKNDKKLSQKLIVHLGVRCDQNPRILNSYQAKISPPRRQRQTESTQQKDAKMFDFLSKSGKKSGQNSKICSICSKYFPSFSKFSSHMRVHTGERPFKCRICLKSFKRMDELKIHSRVHTGERPFSCPLCSKFFSQISNRDTHIRTHTGERPFFCTICTRKFARIHDRIKHMRTHTGERPYSCTVCSKTFARSSNLNLHKKIHNGIII